MIYKFEFLSAFHYKLETALEIHHLRLRYLSFRCKKSVSAVPDMSLHSTTSMEREGSTREKIKLLLVDDDSTILAIVSTLLRMLIYEVTTITSAADALSALQVNSDRFDLVMTDHHMPGMHGFELLERVREEFKIPVIVISADERESLERGDALFIKKPIKLEDLQNIWQFAVATRNGSSYFEKSVEVPSAKL